MDFLAASPLFDRDEVINVIEHSLRNDLYPISKVIFSLAIDALNPNIIELSTAY